MLPHGTFSMGSTDLKHPPFLARATTAPTTPATPFQLRDERQQPDVPAPKAEHHLLQGPGFEGRPHFAGFRQARGRLLRHSRRHRDQRQRRGDTDADTNDVRMTSATEFLGVS